MDSALWQAPLLYLTHLGQSCAYCATSPEVSPRSSAITPAAAIRTPQLTFPGAECGKISEKEPASTRSAGFCATVCAKPRKFVDVPEAWTYFCSIKYYYWLLNCKPIILLNWRQVGKGIENRKIKVSVLLTHTRSEKLWFRFPLLDRDVHRPRVGLATDSPDLMFPGVTGQYGRRALHEPFIAKCQRLVTLSLLPTQSNFHISPLFPRRQTSAEGPRPVLKCMISLRGPYLESSPCFNAGEFFIDRSCA